MSEGVAGFERANRSMLGVDGDCFLHAEFEKFLCGF